MQYFLYDKGDNRVYEIICNIIDRGDHYIATVVGFVHVDRAYEMFEGKSYPTRFPKNSAHNKLKDIEYIFTLLFENGIKQ